MQEYKNKFIERCIRRLADEWVQHGKIIIACDFDDTIFPWRFSDQESLQLQEHIMLNLKRWSRYGIHLVIFTCSNEDRFAEIEEFLAKNNLKVSGINKTPVDSIPWGKSGKIYANVFLDDRSGLFESMEIIERALAIKMVEANEIPE